MALILMVAVVCSVANKPMVPLEESCRKAKAVLVVEPAAEAGTYKVLDVLHDGTGAGLKKNAVIAVDLKGMVYEKGKAYILLLEPAAEAKRYQAVAQARTEDGKETRAKVQKLMEAEKKK